MILETNMIVSVGVAVLILFIGEKIKNRVYFLRKFCIPTPVIGGLLFTLISSIGYLTGSFELKMDLTISKFFMLAFYSSIGFTASYKQLKQGGPKVIKFLIAAIIAVSLQNIIGVLMAKGLGVNPLIGLVTGSIPMTGGHGTSAAFAPMMVEAGVANAMTISLAAATFGLIMGSLIGGPIGRYLIEKKNNKIIANGDLQENKIQKELREEKILKTTETRACSAVAQLLISMALGVIITKGLEMMGMTFTASVGGMLAAAIIRNISDYSNLLDAKTEEIGMLGNISLLLFLAMAMMKLKLWQLVDLAGPMVALLFGQTVLMVFVAIFITYKIMGGDYESAIISAGHCGFGLGATPTAMANIQSLEEKYGPAPNAYFVVPLVGSLGINFFNSIIIILFVNMFS